ncbi:MAG: hypothetical protein R3B99_02110 [Polyangiales bacterium]
MRWPSFCVGSRRVSSPAGRLVLRVEERELAFVSGKSVVLGATPT